MNDDVAEVLRQIRMMKRAWNVPPKPVDLPWLYVESGDVNAYLSGEDAIDRSWQAAAGFGAHDDLDHHDLYQEMLKERGL